MRAHLAKALAPLIAAVCANVYCLALPAAEQSSLVHQVITGIPWTDSQVLMTIGEILLRFLVAYVAGLIIVVLGSESLARRLASAVAFGYLVTVLCVIAEGALVASRLTYVLAPILPILTLVIAVLFAATYVREVR